MFWGLVVEPGKRYEQTVDKSFHISMATLELNSNNDQGMVSVILEYEKQEYILCNLNRQRVFQTSLDLNFRTGDKIAIFSAGKISVHLTGYLTEDLDIDESDSEDEGTSPAKEEVKLNAVKKRKEEIEHALKAKKQKIETVIEEESDEDDEDFDMEAEDAEEEGDEDEDEEDDEEEEDEDEDEDDDEENTTFTKKMQETSQRGKAMQNKIHGEVQEPQSHSPEQQKKKKKQKDRQSLKTPTIEQNGAPQSGKKVKPFTGTPRDGGKGESPKISPGPQKVPKKVLKGGVVVEEVKLGSGPVAEAGRSVNVYYVGRLKQNNKQFDATTQGQGFRFSLGRGEVIKGWDIGVAGMRVGGKRRITCPPQMAYGKKGQPPVIPPNSDLVFEVELRNVN